MTLDEAIKHAEEKSCATEHKQLAEWLKELKYIYSCCFHLPPIRFFSFDKSYCYGPCAAEKNCYSILTRRKSSCGSRLLFEINKETGENSFIDFVPPFGLPNDGRIYNRTSPHNISIIKDKPFEFPGHLLISSANTCGPVYSMDVVELLKHSSKKSLSFQRIDFLHDKKRYGHFHDAFTQKLMDMGFGVSYSGIQVFDIKVKD